MHNREREGGSSTSKDWRQAGNQMTGDMKGSVYGPKVAERSSTAMAADMSDVQREETSTLAESEEKVSMRTEWTNEKHSSYLNSMEASFVNQLYNSLELLNWAPKEECSSGLKSGRNVHASTRVSSGQYKVLQDGCWAKINFRRDYGQLNKADKSHPLSANPWIQHFRSGCRHQVVTSPGLRKQAAHSTTNRFPTSHFHFYCQGSTGSDTEVTDQNFVDEHTERDLLRKEDADCDKSSGLCCRKRMKTSVIAASGSDQVVPIGKFPTTEDVAGNHISRTELRALSGDSKS